MLTPLQSLWAYIMQPSKTFELRAVHIDEPNGVKRIRISVKCKEEQSYTTLEIPNDTEMKWNKIRNIIRDSFSHSPAKFELPGFIQRFLDKQ